MGKRFASSTLRCDDCWKRGEQFAHGVGIPDRLYREASLFPQKKRKRLRERLDQPRPLLSEIADRPTHRISRKRRHWAGRTSAHTWPKPCKNGYGWSHWRWLLAISCNSSHSRIVNWRIR